MQNDRNKKNEPYLHPGDDLAAYFFHQGTTTYAYDYLGAHYRETRGKRTWTFRVWAPNAQAVSLAGDFDDWGAGIPLTRSADADIWETTVTMDPSAEAHPTPDYKPYFDRSTWDGMRYKYRIQGKNGTHLKADPYAAASESLHFTASVLHVPTRFSWDDRSWRLHRRHIFGATGRTPKKERAFYPAPLNIYEMHLGSFRTRDGQTTKDNPDAYLNYREIAKILVPYLKEMGYTHVELMPIMEHPFDGSWGYQICSYYAPTARYGTPDDFKYFVNALHTAGIGVILDWVPAHFPKDEHGLYEFDGQPLYEYQGEDRMEHKGWGTRCFDVGRPEIQSFLISNALFWFREYHIDGLRVDAVAAMLYLDFDRSPGEWVPNTEGNNRNLESIAFFRKLNEKIFEEFPDVLMIAEESTDWPMITKPVYAGGLGFNFKWNMGWANDLFDYVQTDPLFRKYKHDKLTFPLMYAFSENYILPVSHDEVVHGKKSLLDKMFGPYEDKFAATRAFLGYMMTQPGKKMLFMGCEYGPFREWDYENQLEWFMLDFERHKQLQTYTAALNHLYLARRELWEDDFSWKGYTWLNAEDRDQNTIAYARFDASGAPLIAVINFSPVTRQGYTVPLTEGMPLQWEEIFSSDDPLFGGSGIRNASLSAEDVPPAPASAEPMTDGPTSVIHRLTLTLPGYGALILSPRK